MDNQPPNPPTPPPFPPATPTGIEEIFQDEHMGSGANSPMSVASSAPVPWNPMPLPFYLGRDFIQDYKLIAISKLPGSNRHELEKGGKGNNTFSQRLLLRNSSKI